MIKKIIEFIKNLFKVVDENIEKPVVNEIETPKEEIKEEPIIEQEEEKEVVEVPKTTPEEVYVMLTNRERQTYLKKLGLYTKNIDNIRGSGQKKAEKQFNIIFLNKKEDTYTEETDKLLRKVYDSYCASPYMTSDDWKFFKNFKKKEFYCTCKKKYCDGYNGLENKIPMRLLMVLQYVRNYYNKATKLTSTIRCKKRNTEVGGTSGSKHMKFLAVDNNVSGVKASTVVNLVYKGSDKLPFVRYSYAINNNASHIDVLV